MSRSNDQAAGIAGLALLGCLFIGVMAAFWRAWDEHGHAIRNYLLLHCNADMAAGIMIGMLGTGIGLGILLWEARQ